MSSKNGRGRDILAIDFDGTIVSDAYPSIGTPLPGAIETIRDLKEHGFKLILWTCREGKDLAAAVDFLSRQHGIIFDAVNERHPECPYKHLPAGRKIYANHYIDDKAFHGFGGWHAVRSKFMPHTLKMPMGINRSVYPDKTFSPHDHALYVKNELYGNKNQATEQKSN